MVSCCVCVCVCGLRSPHTPPPSRTLHRVHNREATLLLTLGDTTPLSTNQPYALEVHMLGATITVTANGETASVTDPSPLPAGRVGLAAIGSHGHWTSFTAQRITPGLVIGGLPGLPDQGTRMRVAVVREYNRALNPDEVAQNYAATAPRFTSAAAVALGRQLDGPGSMTQTFNSVGLEKAGVGWLYQGSASAIVEGVTLRLAAYQATVPQPAVCDALLTLGLPVNEPYQTPQRLITIVNSVNFDLKVEKITSTGGVDSFFVVSPGDSSPISIVEDGLLRIRQECCGQRLLYERMYSADTTFVVEDCSDPTQPIEIVGNHLDTGGWDWNLQVKPHAKQGL